MLFPLSSAGSSEGGETDRDHSEDTSLSLSICPDDDFEEETEDGSLWLSPHSRSGILKWPPNCRQKEFQHFQTCPRSESFIFVSQPCSRTGTPRVVTPRSGQEHSRCESNLTLDYSVVSLTRPPSFLFKFRKTLEVLYWFTGLLH